MNKASLYFAFTGQASLTPGSTIEPAALPLNATPAGQLAFILKVVKKETMCLALS